MNRGRRFLGRTIRAVRRLVRDPSIPKPVRWLLALSLLPIPGPFDEAVLLLVAPLLFVCYRAALREAWRDAAASPGASSDPTGERD
ncbi:MAG: hypothetical protein ACRDNK_21545 [Solirubrobacteraceae bacterium]